jgi:4-alpha-glucanotransferase
VRDYAVFRAVCEIRKMSWRAWKEKRKWIEREDYDPKVRDLYLFAQWIAQEQMDHLLSRFRMQDLRFYLDLPLGVNPDSFDACQYHDYFANEASAGAPPDSFFTKGQDWGFSPLHPQRIRHLHYQYVIDYLDFQMRHTGMLRIDHVMGLHRLYWVPKGHSARAGAYVRYHADELYAILSLLSHRHKAMLVGENLGTVPPEVNESMDRHGLRRMYVLQYEQGPEGSLPSPEHQLAASLNTHDMPTFAAHWEGADIGDRIDLGLIPKNQVEHEKANREKLRRNLVSFLRRKGYLQSRNPGVKKVLCAAIKFLADSPAETVLVNLEDLWLETRPQNTPGTSIERTNWRGKAALSIKEIREYVQTDPDIRDLFDRLSSRNEKRT